MTFLLLLMLSPNHIRQTGEQEAGPRELPFSSITITGNETHAQILNKLQATGNQVLDPGKLTEDDQRAPHSLSAGNYSFWKLLDAWCSASKLDFSLEQQGITLRPASDTHSLLVAYHGPWRARVLRRSSIAYEDPALDRFLLEVELMLEPRMVPLQASFQSQGRKTTVSFEGENRRLIEFRLPRPPREQQSWKQLVLQGEAWLCPGHLEIKLPLQVRSSTTQQGSQFTITQMVPLLQDRISVSTELLYPEGSFDWESHQAPMLQSMKLTLRQGQQTVNYRSREIQTDAGRRTTARWIFPKVTGAWEAQLWAPATPLKLPIEFVFAEVPLP
ncbi:MAG TPA: hypothetical protein PKA06_05555 [Gemmatales bacterium]|nr:hypothetical protein [Gemmatales bacterium]